MAMYAHLVKEAKWDLKAEHFLIHSPDKQIQNFAMVPPSEDNPGGKIAIHSVQGTLVRDDDLCGGPGMISMANRFMAMDQDPEYAAHLVDMHTPGGSVEGTEYFAQAIANASKPVVVYGEEVFSGGVYIAVGSDHIMLRGKNSAMGSIGVQVSYLSFKRAMESQGIDKVILRASTSPDKNRFDWDNLTEEDIKTIEKEMLDPIDNHFMDHVRAHRPNVSETALTGKEYYAEDAIRLGLADSIGSYQEALSLAASLAAGNNQQQTSRSMSNHQVEHPTQVEEVPAVNPVAEESAAANQESSRIEQMVSVIESKDAVIESQQKLIDQQAKTINQLTAQVEQLSQLPSVDPEQAIISPSQDVTASTQQKEEKPAPDGVLRAIAASKRFHELQNKNN